MLHPDGAADARRMIACYCTAIKNVVYLAEALGKPYLPKLLSKRHTRPSRKYYLHYRTRFFRLLQAKNRAISHFAHFFSKIHALSCKHSRMML